MLMNKQAIMERVGKMPGGIYSPSNRYWCVTCRLLLNIDKPVCPYMTKMCINTPIPIEAMAPESTMSIEKFGLFYPKIPQKMMNFLAEDNLEETGKKWAAAYLNFLREWKFEYKHEPLQTLKSFIITVSGSETAERIVQGKIIFIITDMKKVWEKKKLFPILESAIAVLKDELEFTPSIALDEIDIIGENETGKYYCSMCRKFFEFSSQRDSITCPLMPQKCVAAPRNISTMKYSLADLVSVYSHTPDIYKRFVTALPLKNGWREYLETLLVNEWAFVIRSNEVDCIASHIGITDEKVKCSPAETAMPHMAMG